MKKTCLILSLLVLFSCGNSEPKESLDQFKKREIYSEKVQEPSYTMEVSENAEIGWGYQLFKEGKLMIDQKHIPAIQGEQGFSSKEKAEITGSYILRKIKNGEFPPTVSVQELDSLGVLD
jgi:hypothetical protein